MFTEYDYNNLPIVDIVNDMLIDASRKRASDIHFDPTPDVLNVRIRVDGELILYARVPESVKKNLVTRIKIISGMNITESRVPQDGAIKMQVDGSDLDLRVSTLPIVYGEKVVIRLLDYSASLSSLESLGFSDRNLDLVQKAISKPNGIILVTGATGSGKSTTVYAVLQQLNTIERNIITVEDPVEMKISGINQVQTMSEIGLTFASALRSILRQDPDIIMIGEIRDNETARIAVRASITGHLVLSTIHTNNSLTTIERLVDMDVERYLLGSALEAIISQRLCKKLCPKCREARQTTDYEKRVFKTALNMDIDYIYKPVGCDNCYKGYSGRIPLQEVLVLNQEIRDAIVNNATKEEIRNLIYKDDHATSLLNDGLIKVINGLTSFEEVLRVIDIEDDLGEEQIHLKNAIIGRADKEDVLEKAPEEETTDVNTESTEENTVNENNEETNENNDSLEEKEETDTFENTETTNTISDIDSKDEQNDLESLKEKEETDTFDTFENTEITNTTNDIDSKDETETLNTTENLEKIDTINEIVSNDDTEYLDLKENTETENIETIDIANNEETNEDKEIENLEETQDNNIETLEDKPLETNEIIENLDNIDTSTIEELETTEPMETLE